MKMFNRLFAFIAMMFFSAIVLAQVAPAEPTFLDFILKFIQSPGGIVSTVLVVIEAALRAYPSQKALSLLVVVRYCTKSGIVILTFLDGVLAQVIGAGQVLKVSRHNKKK